MIILKIIIPIQLPVFKGKGFGLQRFLQEVVPLVKSPFVLLIASGDVTIPKNTDLRIRTLPGFDHTGGPNWWVPIV